MHACGGGTASACGDHMPPPPLVVKPPPPQAVAASPPPPLVLAAPPPRVVKAPPPPPLEVAAWPPIPLVVAASLVAASSEDNDVKVSEEAEDICCPCSGGQSCIVERRCRGDWVHEDDVLLAAGLQVRTHCLSQPTLEQKAVIRAWMIENLGYDGAAPRLAAPATGSAAAASTCAHPAAAAADTPPAPRRPSGRINFPPDLCPPEAELDDWTRIKKAFDSKQLVSSGSTFRPPGRSRSRSPPFPKRASPAEVPAVPAVIRPDVSRIDWAGMGLRPQQALGYSRIDWAEMGRETQQKRVAVLQEILNDPRISSDSFKMLLVGEKMDNFQQEDELLRRIQGLEATDLPPPGTPQEHNRKIQVAVLLEELLMTRTLLYHVVGP